MTVSQERLHELLNYDRETGNFNWRVNISNVKAGSLAGTHVSKGYYGIRIDGRLHYCHRLAWFYITGEWPEEVDHKNLIRNDNRIDNLRPSTSSQNKMNRRAQANNKLGVKGVNFNEQTRKFQARIKANGRQRWIGFYDTGWSRLPQHTLRQPMTTLASMRG